MIMLPVDQVSEKKFVVQPLTHTNTHTETAAGSSALLSAAVGNGEKGVKKESEEKWKEVLCSTSSNMTLDTNLLLSGSTHFRWM